MGCHCLKDLAKEWRLLGQAQFAALHDEPALVGIAVAGGARGYGGGHRETLPNMVLGGTRFVDARMLVGSVWPLNKTERWPDSRVLVGRLPECDLVIQDYSVSDRHAEIHLDKGVRVVDLGSKHGTFVNDTPVDAQEPAWLLDWDTIQLGRLQFTFLKPDSLRLRVARLASLLPQDKSNRRSCRRTTVRGTCRIECHLENQPFGHNLSLSAVNLSQTGICIIANTPLAQGAVVEIQLGDFAGGERIKRWGRVIWSKPEAAGVFRAGLCFPCPLSFRDFQVLTQPG